MTESYDLIVIGAGPAGYVASIRAAQLGMRVACVEKEKTLGGTCLNVGCIPSKALLDSSEHFAYARHSLAKHGVVTGEVKLDLPQMMKRRETVVRQLTQGIAGLFKKNQITWLQGTGRFLGLADTMKQIEVAGASGKAVFAARNVLIATGSAPASLPFLPFDGKVVVSSTEALAFEAVPKHLVVVGGGVIGLELGSVWLRLGARVTVIEFLDRILPPMDRQLSEELRKCLVKQGMAFQLATKCVGAQPNSGAWLLEAEEIATRSKHAIECDRILVAVGRKPYTEGLELDAVGIACDPKGRVEIDSRWRTRCPGVYAVGDAVAGPMLAHKAEEEGIAAVESMAGQKGHVNYEAIPNVVYTWPELASVGANEEELKAKGVAYRAGAFPFLANGRAKAMGEADGMVKILADERTGRVLGVHILGPRASDLIAEAVAVMEYGGSAEDIARTCHAHPTLSEAVKEAALAVGRRQLHL